MAEPTRTIGVVLAGAVAQGAFEAGVLRALCECPGVRIARIVAASSGALNGLVLASAVSRGEPGAAVAVLDEVWREHADWREVLHASMTHLARRDGLFDRAGVLRLLREHVTARAPTAEVELRIVVAPLRGVPGAIARTAADGTVSEEPATTFEHVCDFTEQDFASAAQLDDVFTAATASAAFPLVFAPVEVGTLGPCIDGGAVNNSPIDWAINGKRAVALDAIVVVATSAEQRVIDDGALHGARLVGHLAEILIGERLYRDLRDAERRNGVAIRLDRLRQTGALTDDQHRQVLAAVGLAEGPRVELVPIRPQDGLHHNAFAGFFSRDLRVEQLALGYARGRDVLRARGWLG